jgi:hypothetical protein
VLDGLPARGGATPERIATDAGVPVVDVLRCLPALEIGGFAQQSEGGWRVAPAARLGSRGDRRGPDKRESA